MYGSKITRYIPSPALFPTGPTHCFKEQSYNRPVDRFNGYRFALDKFASKKRAVEIYALASSYPYVANSQWFEDVVGRHITKVMAQLPLDVVAAAQKRGQKRDLWATAQELLAELTSEVAITQQ